MTQQADEAAGQGNPVAVDLTIREAVAASLKNLGTRTRESVVEHFAAERAQKQATALIKGLDKLTALERDLNKINRPDVVNYDGNGDALPGVFSKERIEERKKLNEQIEKLTNAINKADDLGDFDKLFELTK